MEKVIKTTPLYSKYVLRSKHDAVVLLGGRFSGKSYNEQIRLAGNMGSKEDYTLLVIEDLETGMVDGFCSGLRDKIYLFEHDPAYKMPERTAFIQNVINGNKALFRGYVTEQQKRNVKKLDQITEIVVEEAEWMTYNDFLALLQQLRGGKKEDRKLTILMNPENEESFVNTEFIQKPADNVLEYFEGTDRPKAFERFIRTQFELDGETVETEISVLVVLSTHYDNPELTYEQRASIEDYRRTDPDKYKVLGECRFIHPKGALLTRKNYFSLSKFNIDQAAKLTAIVDTASSGTDSATLGIYAKVDDEHHYLIDALKDSDDAKKVIPRMIAMINKYQPQSVKVEKNHEGLYYESEIKKGIPKNIIVNKFHSSENKHEKILGQSGRMLEHFYIRDDAGQEYEQFVSEMYSYNKDKKKNKRDDCIDNVAMYYKHGDKGNWKQFYKKG